MEMQGKVNESDWRLFRSRLPEWQEAHMARLNQEYIALLSAPGSSSDKFWELAKRLRQDRKAGGVVMRMSRTYMNLNIMALIADGVIGLDDLEGFSDDLREKMAFIVGER